jgi:hypothetical protein
MRKKLWSQHARRQCRTWRKFLVNLSKSISDLVAEEVMEIMFQLLYNWSSNFSSEVFVSWTWNVLGHWPGREPLLVHCVWKWRVWSSGI